MEQEELDFAEDLKIDPEDLDVEWLRQPGLYLKYSTLVANAKANAQRKEEQVKIIRSELTMEAAKTLDKPTGPNVEAYYRTHPKHIKAKEEWIDAAHEAEVVQQGMWALNHRKDALENLVKLHLAQWFSGPTEPRDLGKAWTEQLEKRRGEQVRTSLVERKEARKGRNR